MEKHQFSLHLPGLIKLLAEHLYSTKDVGIRELIQNAHDSCVRRRLEEGDAAYRPRIDLAIDPARHSLTIRDNGSGLTSEEITNYLATIGRGYTRELREELEFCSPSEAAELIGQFGLGFLSTYLIASEVTLTTRSFHGNKPLRWHCVGDENYELAPGSRDEVGTTIELRIKPAASFLLQENVLIETVRRYADFVPTPVYLEGDFEPLNCQSPPWEDDDSEEAILAYINRTFQGVQPLYVGHRPHHAVRHRANVLQQVAPRAYRLRIVNASNARIYRLAWSDGEPLHVIGGDNGLYSSDEGGETRLEFRGYPRVKAAGFVFRFHEIPSMPRWRSLSASCLSSSGVAPRRMVPASGRMVTMLSRSRTRISGEDPTIWKSP